MAARDGETVAALAGSELHRAYRWTPPRPGRYEFACRAIDGRGQAKDPTRRHGR